MKYLVTGATGFLGSHVVAALQAHGHRGVPFSRSAGGDVLDGDRVRAAARGCDGAFHCAGKVSRKPEDAEELYRVHVEGTKVVLEACAAAGVPRIVVASSSGTVAVSEDPDSVATEDDPCPIGILGRWPYYRAKLFAEQAALSRGRSGGSPDVVCVNPSLLLGPGDMNGSSTSDVRMFLEGRVLAVPAGGFSFVDVRDAAEAMCSAMARGRSGERYLVGGCNVTAREFLGRLSRISGVRGPWIGAPRAREFARVGASWLDRATRRLGWPSPVDPVAVDMAQFYWYLDASKAKRELGFQARDPNATLYDTVFDLRARGVVWPPDAAAGS
jgi:dihydroflavonol-4-reductase